MTRPADTTRPHPAAVAAACLLAALTVAGAFLPSALTWGFHFLAFLPRTYLVGYVALTGLLLWFAFRGDVGRLVARPARLMGRQPVAFLALAVGAFALFATIMRVQAPLLGDSFYLVRNYSEAARGVAPLYYRDEPLATLLFSLLLDLFGVATFREFLASFLSAEILLGAATIVALFWTIRLLVREDEDRFLAFAFVLAFPVMQLFFGYVEIYAAVVCAVAVFLLAAALHLTGRLRFRYLPPLFLAVSLTHYGTLLLAPAIVFLGVRETREHGPREATLGAGLVAGAVMTLLVMVGFDLGRYSSWVPHSHFLPVAPPTSGADAYTTAFTLFSGYHVLDVANLVLLVAPASLLLIAVTLTSGGAARRDPALHRFFLAGILPALAFLFVVKYDLGGARDWDAFTFVYFTLALCAVVFFLTTELPGRRRTVFLLAGLTALNSYLFFAVNHRDSAGVARFHALFDQRLLSQAGYYSGSLYLAQYYHQVGNAAGPVGVWQRYLRAFPTDERAYRNVLVNATRNSPLPEEETAALFERWLTLASDSSDARAMYAAWCAGSGDRRVRAGDGLGAERLYRRAAELDPDAPRVLEAFGACLARNGRPSEALPVLERAIFLDTARADLHWLLAKLRLERGERSAAAAHLAAAARLGYPGAAALLDRLRHAPTTTNISITSQR